MRGDQIERGAEDWAEAGADPSTAAFGRMREMDADALEAAPLKAIIAWYAALSEAAGGWPAVSDFRPEELAPSALPHLARVDVELSPFRVFIRAAGSVIEASLGCSVDRQYLDKLDLPQAGDLEDWYRWSVTANRPLFVRGDQDFLGQRFTLETMCLPFGEPGDDPRAFVAAEAYLPSHAWREAIQNRHYGEPPGTE